MSHGELINARARAGAHRTEVRLARLRLGPVVGKRLDTELAVAELDYSAALGREPKPCPRCANRGGDHECGKGRA